MANPLDERWTPWTRAAYRRRVPVDMPVTLLPDGAEGAGAPVRASARDLSRSGLGVVSPVPLAAGSRVHVAFDVPLGTGPRRVMAAGRIRWSREGVRPQGPASLGIEFVGLLGTGAADLEAFLADTDAPAPRGVQDLRPQRRP